MLHHISLRIQQTLGTNKFQANFPFLLHCILFIILSCNSMQKIAGTKRYFLVALHRISLSSKTTGCSQLLAKKKKTTSPITPHYKHQLQHVRIQHTFGMKQFHLVAASISLHLLSLHETLCCSTYIANRSTVNEILTALHKTDIS